MSDERKIKIKQTPKQLENWYFLKNVFWGTGSINSTLKN